jgi:aryl-alcohol dehydrogenase-like predicted oxidoreductase
LGAGYDRGACSFSSQPQYSARREPEDEVIPLCAANGISQIVWSPLGQGVLSGKYDPARPPPKDSRATSAEMGGFIDRLMQPQVLHAVQRLKPVAEEAALTMPQFALAWVPESRTSLPDHRRVAPRTGPRECGGLGVIVDAGCSSGPKSAR